MKRLTLIGLVCLMIVFSISISALAGPMYCPNSPDGKCYMVSIAIHVLTNYDTGQLVFSWGGLYQCRYCDDYFCCSGRPHFGEPIGYHVFWGGMRDLLIAGLNSSCSASTSSIYYTTSSTLPMMRFLSS